MQAMELQMVDESFRAIESFQWEWNGPISDQRAIIDTGALMNSIELGSVESEQNSISFSLRWDPVDPGTDPTHGVEGGQIGPQQGKHYASLVHNGQAGYFQGEEGGDFAKDYTARPWTFLLIPAEQRDDSEIYTDTGPATESLPEDGWEAAMKAFDQALRQQLTTQFQVIT